VAAADGISFEEERGAGLVFRLEDGEPVVEVVELGEVLAKFEGSSAYRGARHYLED
jgi:hypothetical protein